MIFLKYFSSIINIMLYQNFKALALKFDDSSKHSHYIYFKEHSIREKSGNKPPGRTLFVLNIPPYVDQEGIKRAFNKAGQVENVIFCEKPSSDEIDYMCDNYFIKPLVPTFKIAYVIFKKVSELDKALQLEKLECLSDENNKVDCGLIRFIKDYNRSIPNSKVLKKEIDIYIKKFDLNKQKADDVVKELEQETEDGWVTVTKNGKVQSFQRTEKVENKIKEKEELGKKRKELQNFYTFQIRESKMKKIVALREKFEEDKKKIIHLKQTRRFKPF